MRRFTVDHVTAYGRQSFRVVDNHESGVKPYVVARCETQDNAEQIARFFNMREATSDPVVAAAAAMEVLKDILLAQPLHPLDEYGEPVDAEGCSAIDPTPAGDIARGWCYTLLRTAKAVGLGGCPLCRS